MSTNQYFITILCGNNWVTDYQIYYKPFSVGATIVSLAMTPIWSAVTKAMAENNYSWIEKLYKILLKVSFIGVFFVFLLVPALQIFMNIWLGEESINVNYLFAVVFAIFGGLLILNSAFSSIANGLGELKTQAITFGIGAVIKFPLAVLFVLATNSWIGVVLSNVTTMGLYCIVQPVILKKEILKLRK